MKQLLFSGGTNSCKTSSLINVYDKTPFCSRDNVSLGVKEGFQRLSRLIKNHSQSYADHLYRRQFYTYFLKILLNNCARLWKSICRSFPGEKTIKARKRERDNVLDCKMHSVNCSINFSALKQISTS